jgi:hypothetical protein
VEAITGKPIVFIHQYEDGSSQVEVMFEIDRGQLESQSGSAYLEGPGLAGIEAFHNLPVRIWGEFTAPTHNRLTINVERVEPIFPDLSLQTWLGRFEPVTLEDKNVLLFTADGGQQYVLGFSVNEPTRQIEFGPGDPIVIEGYVVPEKTIGGYPLIQDLAINPGQGLQDLSAYQPQSLQPFIMQESGTAGAAKKGTVTSIELVYYTEDLRYPEKPAGSPLPYAQPVWRFSGTYEDDSPFQILIQALSPQYLVHP